MMTAADGLFSYFPLLMTVLSLAALGVFAQWPSLWSALLLLFVLYFLPAMVQRVMFRWAPVRQGIACIDRRVFCPWLASHHIQAFYDALPYLESLLRVLPGLGRTGWLHIAIECHACFDWLFPVLEMFRHAWPEIDVDIRAGLPFEALPALNREDVDLVISSDREPPPGIVFNPLFDYHPTFVGSAQNPLAAKEFITAEDFRDQVLITYPVSRDKLDIFTEVLTPAKVEPRAQRTAELTAVILMLVGSNRVVAVLPDWVMREVKTNADYITRPLGRGGHETDVCGDAGGGCGQALHRAFPAAGAVGAGEIAARVGGLRLYAVKGVHGGQIFSRNEIKGLRADVQELLGSST